MLIKEELIKKYFDSWLLNNSSQLNNIFAKDIVYSECYGPEYHGLNQIVEWFNDWNKRGSVLKWEIKQLIHQQNIVVAEWYFECKYDGSVFGFDGVSIVEFNNDGKIKNLKEFESKSEHLFPYGV